MPQKIFVRECPKCREKIDVKLIQRQIVNSKMKCGKCNAIWLVPNKFLKEDAEFKGWMHLIGFRLTGN